MSKEMEYLPRLKLLDWYSYPRKRLPPKFQPECLVELYMECSKLEKLWGGIQPLANLKEINLRKSRKLKEIPNLSEATNLETLTLEGCTSLVELPSSIRNLHKLRWLGMKGCVKLRVIPTNINLASLEELNMSGCLRLRTFPDISSNINSLDVRYTKIEDVPASVAGSWLRLETLAIGSKSLKRLGHVPESVWCLNLSNSDIKKIPDCVIGLPRLHRLIIQNCRKLVSLQSLPPSLRELNATDCGSLKSVCFSFDEPRAYITLNNCKCVRSEEDTIRVTSNFYNPTRQVSLLNCLKLDEEARRAIIQRWAYRSVCLPGKEIPSEFTHKAKGNSITISEETFSASSRFKACLLLSPMEQVSCGTHIVCCLRSKGVPINELNYCLSVNSRPSWTECPPLLTEHLLVFSGTLLKEHICLEADAITSKIQFEFKFQYASSLNCNVNDDKIIECGVQILAEEDEIKISSSFDDPNIPVSFVNCLKLDKEARRAIIQRWAYRSLWLPGKEVPAEFTHKARGNSITISKGAFSASSRFKACLLLSQTLHVPFGHYYIVCRLRSKGVLINKLEFLRWYHRLLTDHLIVFPMGLFKEHRCVEVDANTSEIQFEFSFRDNDDKIIECGVQILAEEGESSSSQWKEQSDGAVKKSKHTGWWSWLRKLGLRKKKKE